MVDFPDLRNTMVEIKGIASEYKDAVIDTGSGVNEAYIKQLSEKGKLKKYKVLHFSTHGIVDPDMPELSALVLSIPKNKTDKDDGYLTMKEIVNLKIEADFVNLSACNTGLGRLYNGEGIVGLTQAFLIAGANGVSVSLWSVEDESTMKFMIGLYELVKDKRISYSEAITEMKRAFINGKIGDGSYVAPFYWAPFVYYGK